MKITNRNELVALALFARFTMAHINRLLDDVVERMAAASRERRGVEPNAEAENSE